VQVRYTLAGWVSARDLPDATSMLEEVQKLRKERDDALAELKQIKALAEKQAKKTDARWEDEEFDEILNALNELEINTKIYNKNPAEPPAKIKVLQIVDISRDRLITGVTNSAGTSDRESLLYFNVCPKLEMYELASIEKVPNVAWQRYRLTAKGRAFLIYLDKRRKAAKALAKPSDKTAASASQSSPVALPKAVAKKVTVKKGVSKTPPKA
jgi:hypothetical protein